jgi:hypothetical protein
MKEVLAMPIISAFFGIIIRMYFKDTEQHNKPHFHAKYGEYEASFDLHGNLLAGDFPPKQSRYVNVWADIHNEELSALWEIMQTDEDYYKIKGLE